MTCRATPVTSTLREETELTARNTRRTLEVGRKTRRSTVSKQRVLFLCTHNSARSQMAEGFLRSLAGDRFEVASAGTEATRVHPLAVRAMSEVGVDLNRNSTKTDDRILPDAWDFVITACDAGRDACPVFPKNTRTMHRRLQ